MQINRSLDAFVQKMWVSISGSTNDFGTMSYLCFVGMGSISPMSGFNGFFSGCEIASVTQAP